MAADDEFLARFREVLARSGLSMRALSAALGRDPGYVAALLDPSRPSRARPTPADLLQASDATGIPFVELLETLWWIEPSRLADELGRLGLGGFADTRLASCQAPRAPRSATSSTSSSPGSLDGAASERTRDVRRP